MDTSIHIAITRSVRPAFVPEFERALADFARQSLAEAGARGVHVLYPPAGSGSTEYGILRSFASEEDRRAFYASPLYEAWTARIAPMVDGEPEVRRLDGLEAWFRGPATPPPRWKMAILTWIAVWPVSMGVAAIVGSVLSGRAPAIVVGGVIAAAIVVVLTWGAMPLLVRLAHPWLAPRRTANR